MMYIRKLNRTYSNFRIFIHHLSLRLFQMLLNCRNMHRSGVFYLQNGAQTTCLNRTKVKNVYVKNITRVNAIACSFGEIKFISSSAI